MRKAAPLLAPLFRSDSQAELLAELLIPDSERSLAELSERATIPYATVHREVARLKDAGLLTERRVGNTRLVRGNPDSPLLAPVRQILLTVTGPVVLIRQELGQLDGIVCAFLFGSFAARAKGVQGPPPNDIDLMLVGDPDPSAVYRACRNVSDQVRRVVNPTIMTLHEWSENTGFVADIRNNPIVEIIGDQTTCPSSR
ncbi:MAG: winged helix-turn-helix domain-containing protein [Jatrophihabitantaceae bacterium]